MKAWRTACVSGAEQEASRRQAEKAQACEDKKRIKVLEKELRRKDKALAETAALLALRKKLNALWEDDEEG